MIKLSAFADEVGEDLTEQLSILAENKVGNIELRGVWGKNVLELNVDEIKSIRLAADEAGIGFSAIGSPIGKFPLDGDFQLELDALDKAIEYASMIDAPYIRIFSYYIPDGDTPETHRSQVHDWIAKLIERAEKSDTILAHENERGIYGDSPERCNDLLTTFTSPSFTGIFDFANFVVYGARPYETCWPLLKEHITYFHIKDYRISDSTVTPAGEGDGNVQKILSEAYRNGFDNFLTLEPHLSQARASSGSTSPELFKIATLALKKILDNLGQAFE